MPTLDGWDVASFRGDVVLLAHDDGPIPGTISGPVLAVARPSKARARHRFAKRDDPDDTIHHYSFRLETVEGAPIANLAVPSGMAYASVSAVDAAGEAVGFAFPQISLDDPVLVCWDRSGTPTVLDSGEDADEVAIAPGGRVVAANGDSGILTVYEGGAKQRTKGWSDGSTTVSPDGRRAMVYRVEPETAKFYRLP